jgi:PhzF family phenazine biosynthesis protein
MESKYSEAEFYQVDAFSDRLFSGNPAAVCIMPCDLKDSVYQSIAKEMNLSETAFAEKVQADMYKLRWFTPKKEVPLCGHATLATSHVIFDHLGFKGNKIQYSTLSGILSAEKVKDKIQLDFPKNEPYEAKPSKDVYKGLGISGCKEAYFSDTTLKLLLEVESPEIIKKLKPDFKALLEAENNLGWRGIIVTARDTREFDFISRYFAPHVGINEDPVTGSAHTVLAPYWGNKLNKKTMRAYQASERGGVLTIENAKNRVYISGKAVTVIVGQIRY